MVNYYLKSYGKLIRLEAAVTNSKLARLIIENQFVQSLEFHTVFVSEPLQITLEEVLESSGIY